LQDRTFSTALVVFKSALDRFLTLLFRERSRKNKTATLNEHISVLAAILSDISDNSVTNLSYVIRQFVDTLALAACGHGRCNSWVLSVAILPYAARIMDLIGTRITGQTEVGEYAGNNVLFYLYTVSERMSTTQQRRTLKTNKTPNEITVCSQTNSWFT